MKRVVSFGIASAVVAGVIIGCVSNITNAAGHNAGDNTIDGGGCLPSGTRDGARWIDTCVGGSWKRSSAASLTTGGSNHVGAKSWDSDIAVCRSINAPSYYFLSLDKYIVSNPTGNNATVGSVINDGKGFGSYYAKQSRNEGGSYGDSGIGESWGEVKRKFELAAANGATFGKSWGDTSFFCWSDEWDCPEGDCPEEEDDVCTVEEEGGGEGGGLLGALIGALTGGGSGGGSETETESPDIMQDYEAGGAFYLYSTVTVHNNTGGRTFRASLNDSNSSYDLSLSTDSSVDINLHVDNVDMDEALKSGQGFVDNAYPVGPAYTADKEGVVAPEGTPHSFGSGSDSFSPASYSVSGDGTATLAPAPGETLSICVEVSVDKAGTTMEGTETDKCEGDHVSWEIHEKDSAAYGPLVHTACVSVYRPADPTETVYTTDSLAGPDAKLMYAGNQSFIGWNASARWQGARQVDNYRAIAFLVPENVNSRDGRAAIDRESLSVIPRERRDPCAFYNLQKVWCAVVEDYEGDRFATEGVDNWSKSQRIAVPDYVGYKYCAAYGYYWQSYYEENFGGWQIDASQPGYWTNSKAACSTIAKKPSAAVWNGGILTNGGVKTSLSQRMVTDYANPGGKPQTSWSFQNLYGSWTEHLLGINGSVNGTASGSALANGSGSNTLFPDNSYMTIANHSSDLGKSGINTSQTFRTRLDAYLKNLPGVSTNFSSIPANPISSGTYIINHSGDLHINRNIILADGPYSSIYTIPQVIIFVTGGDVTIDPSVTRIDAWIIADDSTLDTCKIRATDTSIGTNSAVGAIATNLTCDQQLIFNGPVLAKNMNLNRTYGADRIPDAHEGAASETPAEIFNLSGESYYWAYAQAGRYKSSYTEVYSRELAPRY